MLNIETLINLPENKSRPVCFNCGSKLYPGDTIYIIDRENYCEDCVEVSEFESVLD
jgi:RNase P subunit RPR2